MKRAVIGFLAAPVIGASCLNIALAFIWGRNSPGFYFSEAVMFFGALFAYPPALLLGVPLFVAFLRRGWLSWWASVLGGALVGIGGAAGLTLVIGNHESDWVLEKLAVTTFVGAVAGMAFWLIAVFRNSALTAARTPTRAGEAGR